MLIYKQFVLDPTFSIQVKMSDHYRNKRHYDMKKLMV